MKQSSRSPRGLTAAAVAMSCALASCALTPEPEPAPRRTPIATRTPTATPTPRAPIDESPAEEFPALDSGHVPPAPDGARLPDTTVPTTSEPESMLTRIKSSTPPNVAASYRLIEEARRLMAQGDVAQATHRLERSVAIDPMNPYGYYFLAEVHLQARAYDQAIGFAGRAAALSARSDPLCGARSYTLQGTAYEQAGRFADARAAYTKALQNDPRNPAARLGLARLSGQ